MNPIQIFGPTQPAWKVFANCSRDDEHGSYQLKQPPYSSERVHLWAIFEQIDPGGERDTGIEGLSIREIGLEDFYPYIFISDGTAASELLGYSETDPREWLQAEKNSWDEAAHYYLHSRNQFAARLQNER